MESADGWQLLILGAMLLAGFLAHLTGPLIHVPRVTLLILAGVLLGPHLLGVVPDEVAGWFPFVTHLALAIIGFLLGEEFRWRALKEKGPQVLVISVGETLAAAAVVFAVVLLLRQDPVLALVLAGIAPASAPAATVETLREGRARGPLTDTVLEVVAIDDAWGVIAFSLLLVAATALGGQGAATGELLAGLWEVTGAILLGAAVGLPMAWINDRIRDRELTLVEAIGFVVFQTGVASLLGVSYLLAAVVLGAVVVNRAGRKHAFQEVEHVREPFMAIFFILAGMKLDLGQLLAIGWIGAGYVLARAGGLALGGWLAGWWLDVEAQVRRRIGWCLMPQAGVALGFALLARERLPGYGDLVLTLVIASTVLFEIGGPLLTRLQLRRAGEWGVGRGAASHGAPDTA